MNFHRYTIMDKTKTYQYNWSDYEGYISWSIIFKTWRWSVNSLSTDYTDFRSHIDIDLDTPKDAEEDMMYEIRTHLGSTPESQF